MRVGLERTDVRSVDLRLADKIFLPEVGGPSWVVTDPSGVGNLTFQKCNMLGDWALQVQKGE